MVSCRWLLVAVFLLVYQTPAVPARDHRAYSVGTHACLLSPCQVKNDFEGDNDAFRSKMENLAAFQSRMEVRMQDVAALEETVEKLEGRLNEYSPRSSQGQLPQVQLAAIQQEIMRELNARLENMERLLLQEKNKNEELEKQLKGLVESSHAPKEFARVMVVSGEEEYNVTNDEIEEGNNQTMEVKQILLTLASHDLQLTNQKTKMAVVEKAVEKLQNDTIIQDQKLEEMVEWMMMNMTEYERSISDYVHTAMAETNNRTKRMILQESDFKTELSQLQTAFHQLNATVTSVQEEQAMFKNKTPNSLNEMFLSISEKLENSRIVVENTTVLYDTSTTRRANSNPLVSNNGSCYFTPSRDPDLSVLVDGKEIRTDAILPHGAKLTYKCKGDKLKMKGLPSSKCQNMAWTSQEPICLKSTDKDEKYGTATNPCPQKDGNFRDLKDCTKFYQCGGGIQHGIQSCPKNLYFHQDLDKCLFEKPKDCV